MSFFTLRNVSKSFEKKVLQDFSIDLEKGEILSLVGESGSGKSTLLRIMAGLQDYESGQVILDEQTILSPNKKLVPGYDEIQLIHQDYGLYPSSTVLENLKRPLLAYDAAYANERIIKILRLLGLEGLENKLPRQLSGGQQQKVAIGRALSIEPSVLLLDEPFSSLDTIQTRELIIDLKIIFKSLSMTVVFVTHDIDDAIQMSDRVVIIQNGRLIQEGNAVELYQNPKSLYVAKLFSHLNCIDKNLKQYIRPSDIGLFKSNGIRAEILDKKHLIHYDLLTVRSEKLVEVWQVEDKERRFQIGDKVYLRPYSDKVLHLKK
jgi:iron(III) transport system ATP-binding protein